MADDAGNELSLPKGAWGAAARMRRHAAARRGARRGAALACSTERCAESAQQPSNLLAASHTPCPLITPCAATIAKLVKEYLPAELRASAETVDKIIECCTGGAISTFVTH